MILFTHFTLCTLPFALLLRVYRPFHAFYVDFHPAGARGELDFANAVLSSVIGLQNIFHLDVFLAIHRQASFRFVFGEDSKNSQGRAQSFGEAADAIGRFGGAVARERKSKWSHNTSKKWLVASY